MKTTISFLAQAGGSFATFLLIEVLLIFALIAGIAKCCSISRRPTTNTKCAMALGLLLIGCLIPHVSQAASAVIGRPFPDLASFISLGITLGSAVLAVVGLREYSRSRGVYNQGKTQAIWTLALAAFVAAYPILFLAQSKWNILRIERPRLTAEVAVFTNLNFKFFIPGEPWQQVEADPLNLKPALALRCARYDLHFAVVSQSTPLRKYSTDELGTLATNIASERLDDLKVLSSNPFRKEALRGVQLDLEAGHRGQPLYLENRVFHLNRWTYHLIAWGPKRHETTVMDHAERLAYRFELLDYTSHEPLFDDLPNFSVKP